MDADHTSIVMPAPEGTGMQTFDDPTAVPVIVAVGVLDPAAVHAAFTLSNDLDSSFSNRSDAARRTDASTKGMPSLSSLLLRSDKLPLLRLRLLLVGDIVREDSSICT